ncbi:MAG: prepilin peptidase, partial [Candidatus Omnitrophota bacterium]|nr:prepilin peptidase [Candidatus Omnitrophota bacterium]
METLAGVFVFIFGTIIGSFLNVCIHRLPKNESVVSPMSHCPNCNRDIFWYDNIPVLSYIVLKGRCRFCGSKISFRYFIVELLTGLVLFLLFLAFGITPKFFTYGVFVCGLVVATFVDFEMREIPDQVSLGGIIVGLAAAVIFPSIFDTASRFSGILNSFLGVLAGGGSIYAMGFFGKLAFRKEAMGGGDVKL